jgi:putative selenium metabolism protein SsnA
MVAMTEPLLFEHTTILTLGEPGRVLHDHALLIEGGVISAIAPSGRLSAGRSIDASGKILMPGFINAHMHCYSTFARGLIKIAPAHTFPEVLDHLWWRLDKALTLEDCYFSALVVLLEAIRNGTTTLIDHHASPSAISGSLVAIARAFTETSLRGCLCYEVSDRDGPASASEGLNENAEFIRSCRENPSPLLKGLMGLHASFTLGDATLRRAAELGHAIGAGFHIHAAEAKVDQEYTLQQHGMRVIDRLDAFGILGPDSIAAHCVHINEREMELLAGSGTAVVHNPQSNMNNAAGIADITTMQQRGVVVGLGTDAMTTRMSEEVRTALWGQHLLHRDPAIGFTEAASTLLVNNPKIARRIFGQPLGEIAVGAPADIVLIDYDPPTPLSQENWPGQFIFGIAPAPVDTTVVAGRVLMRDKKLLLELDEREIYCKTREQAEALWKRM